MAQKLRAGSKAFSLLELVVTVAILATGITVILQAFSYSSRMCGLSCDIVTALLTAEDKMQELEFKEKQNLINKEPPEVTGESGKFAWKYALHLEPQLNLYDLNFEITWQRLERKEKLNLSTYLR